MFHCSIEADPAPELPSGCFREQARDHVRPNCTYCHLKLPFRTYCHFMIQGGLDSRTKHTKRDRTFEHATAALCFNALPLYASSHNALCRRRDVAQIPYPCHRVQNLGGAFFHNRPGLGLDHSIPSSMGGCRALDTLRNSCKAIRLRSSSWTATTISNQQAETWLLPSAL
jgi:hypothetical protein